MVWTPFTRADHDRSSQRYASDMTDKEWCFIAPFMPPQPSRGRKRKTDLRSGVAAIFYVLQSGCQWGLLPKDFPPKSTVHHYFKRFRIDGTWSLIHDALYRQIRDLEGREESPSYAIIDSQSIKTGPEARGDTGFDAGKKIKGRKRHILVDTLGMILKTEVHAAGIQDRDGAALVFDKLTSRFPFLEKSAVMAGTKVQLFNKQAQGQWKSSSGTRKVSRFCPNAGSSNEPSHGSASTDACQRISSASPKPAWPSSRPP